MNLQEKAVEIAKKYETLPIQDKINFIAKTFGCNSGNLETICSNAWPGTSDIFIRFDNGTSLCIGSHKTQQAKTVNVQNAYINDTLLLYHPEIVAITKETALAALKKQELRDNVIAAQMGLKPYTLLNVEFNDGTYHKSMAHRSWYYVTIAVDGRIRAHLESRLSYAIADGKAEEAFAKNYCSAGSLGDTEVDYVFGNIGFSSTSKQFSLPIADDVLKRAEKTLAERGKAHPDISFEHTQPRKHSIKAQLAARLVPGDKPAAKTKDREVR